MLHQNIGKLWKNERKFLVETRPWFQSFFHNFLGGDINLLFRHKMRIICAQNRWQIFRNISEMCVWKFWISADIFMSPRRIFRVETIFAKIRENYAGRNIKTFWYFFQQNFPNFLLLHCKEIFLGDVNLDQTGKKKMDVYDVTIVWSPHRKE